MRVTGADPSLEESFLRALEEEEGVVVDPCYVVDTSSYDMSLHIASIFVLFFASALGVCVPLLPKYSKRLNTYPYLIILGKCAGAGVMISCALVHMLLPSTESLTNECLPPLFTTYPAFSFTLSLFASLSTHLAEHFVEAYLLDQGAQQPNNEQGDKANSEADLQLPCSVQCSEIEESTELVAKAKNADTIQKKDCSGDAPRQVVDIDDQLRKAKQFSETLVVEFSLSVHSILVGLALGVTFDESFNALLIALVFHQMLEGVALGCRLADSVLGLFHEIMFAIIFAICCPIGTIIGISVYQTINQSGQTFLLVQGIFDGISGGLLLYNGFLLLLKDFPEDIVKHCRGDSRNLKKFGMFAALWGAAFAMSIIGAWA